MKRFYLLYFVILSLISVFLLFPQQQVIQFKKTQKIQRSIVNPWPKWCDKAMEATRESINLWGVQVKIINAKINAVSVIAAPGCMSSPTIKNNIKNFMILKQVPDKIAAGFAKGISGQWEKWQNKVTIPGLPLYPAFAAFPGPLAPPIPGIPFPLSAFKSSGLSQLTSHTKIKRAIKAGLGSEANSPGAEKYLDQFSSKFAVRFLIWISKVKVKNLMGSGPVPTFAPPYIPVGPVVNGKIHPVPGILSNFKF